MLIALTIALSLIALSIIIHSTKALFSKDWNNCKEQIISDIGGIIYISVYYFLMFGGILLALNYSA
tara:strand:+ start:611 stop:808 length:198 start_codon:yes stop_codon:yes gene_type:complete